MPDIHLKATWRVTSLPGRGAPLVWLPGWGCDHTFYLPAAAQLQHCTQQILVDCPGWGGLPPPPTCWDLDAYVEDLFQLLQGLQKGPLSLCCHSFGARLALRLAARHPEVVQRLILVAGAGLRTPPPWWRQVPVTLLRSGLRMLAPLLPPPAYARARSWFIEHFGSADYKAAGPLRPILVRILHEDQSRDAEQVQAPVLLLYGREDSATPPSLGRRLAKLLPHAQLLEMPGCDHWSILLQGRFLVAHYVEHFLTCGPPLGAGEVSARVVPCAHTVSQGTEPMDV